jgi:hypothetical protein
MGSILLSVNLSFPHPVTTVTKYKYESTAQKNLLQQLHQSTLIYLYPSTLMICLQPSTLICLYTSFHAVLVTGSERACKTMLHAPDVQCSLYFDFASLSFLHKS